MAGEQCSEKIGIRFGKLVVLAYDVHDRRIRLKCVCDCGSLCAPLLDNVRSRKTKSCGCGRSETTDFMERVRQKVMVNENGCWIWKSGEGYGKTAIGGRSGKYVKVHCEVFRRTRGPIPLGMFVCHNCPGGKDVKACCNPDHLYIGDRFDNARDAVERNQLHIGDRCKWAKLTEQKARDIFERYHRGGVTLAILGKEFGVHIVTISEVINRRNWRRATEESAKQLGVKNESAATDYARSSGGRDDSRIG